MIKEKKCENTIIMHIFVCINVDEYYFFFLLCGLKLDEIIEIQSASSYLRGIYC